MTKKDMAKPRHPPPPILKKGGVHPDKTKQLPRKRKYKNEPSSGMDRE